MTTERPILFSAPMVRSLLAGTKTQTRRVVKWRGVAQGLNLGFGGLSAFKECHGWSLSSRSTGGQWGDRTEGTPCPYGQPGDRLWVREAHSIGPGPGVPLEPGETAGALRWPHITYSADGAVERRDTRWKGAFGVGRPSIHMPRWASRITLEVTDVRVERLQAITRGDAMAEGCPFANMAAGPDPRDWYRDLWNEINGPGAWDLSPWVWVVAFKVVKP